MSLRPYILINVFFLLAISLTAQISPGDLAEVHKHLEGMANCTQCHTLGEKVSNEKCLDCHKEIKVRIDGQRGYHYSDEIRGKQCVECHNDHHGRKFEIIRFDKDKFNHNLTGYELEGAHMAKQCDDCHKSEFIIDAEVKDKQFTYLGLGTSCLDCHEDYHQNTLSVNCTDCHGQEKFTPAAKFNHRDAQFVLRGKHLEVDCIECHRVEEKNGKKYQQFTGLQFANCTACHTDVHNNKFGPNCTKCHTEQSFHTIKDLEVFNHNLTNFTLEGSHQQVDCITCHKTNYTDPLKHDRCMDCHSDYHRGEFDGEDFTPDCADCHNVQSFSEFSFTIEQHNNAAFPLEGAHLATPCFDCHLKEDRWTFREIGIKCADCHEDIHKNYIDANYYPNSNCLTCHTVNWWAEVVFDHKLTNFALEGEHAKQSCRACHFEESTEGSIRQKFEGLSPQCFTCHSDQHYGQFEENGETVCEKCHTFNNWNADNFNHATSRFKLDGEHENVACTECHKLTENEGNRFVKYKFEDIRCEACHQ
jgi:hypothetical protein